MKKIIKILLITILIIFIKLSFTYALNEFIIYNYNNGNYNTKIIKGLYFLNFYQKYIAYYNEGNILYRTSNYEQAIEKYETSLNNNPPKNKVCDIRINLSLAIIKNTDINNKTEALSNLNKAKNVLYENNCANPLNNKGESEKAEKLEDEIKDLEEQIKNNTSQSDPESDPNEQEPTDEELSGIEEELKEKEKQSNAKRQNDLNNYESYGNYSYYTGKKW